METGLYSNDFSQVFAELLKKTGVSCYQISVYSQLDQAYLSRLKSGEKRNPSPEAMVRISLAFARLSPKFTLLDAQRLLKSTGRSLRISD